MDENWVEFDERRVVRGEEHHLTLNDDGEFMMNRCLYEDLGSPEAVTLHFDSVNDRIGIRRADKRLPNAIRVRRFLDSGGRVVRSRSFMNKWDIRLDGTYCFPQASIENGMLILPLITRYRVTRPRRRRQ